MIRKIFGLNGCCDEEIKMQETRMHELIRYLGRRVDGGRATDCEREVLTLLRDRLEELKTEATEAQNA